MPYPARATNELDSRYAKPIRGENMRLGMKTPQVVGTCPAPQISTWLEGMS